MLEVKRAYRLSVDRREAAALERILPGKTRARGAREPARPVGDDILLAQRDRAPGRLDDWGLLICRHRDARGVSWSGVVWNPRDGGDTWPAAGLVTGRCTIR